MFLREQRSLQSASVEHQHERVAGDVSITPRSVHGRQLHRDSSREPHDQDHRARPGRGTAVDGRQNILSHVTVVGSGDALQVNGPTLNQRQPHRRRRRHHSWPWPAFFYRSELQSNGVFMWIRNTSANHDNVFVECTFKKRGSGVTELARAPMNNGRAYPYAEAVLINAKLDGISPAAGARWAATPPTCTTGNTTART